MGLLKIVNDVYENNEAKSTTIIVSLDISSAFDMICHSKLLDMLQQDFGIDDAAHLWITSYLRNWSQFVQIGSRSSTMTSSIWVSLRACCSSHYYYILHKSRQLEKSSGVVDWITISTPMIRSSTTLSAQGTLSLISKSSKLACSCAEMVSQQWLSP